MCVLARAQPPPPPPQTKKKQYFDGSTKDIRSYRLIALAFSFLFLFFFTSIFGLFVIQPFSTVKTRRGSTTCVNVSILRHRSTV